MAHLASAAASTPRTSGWGASISDDRALRLRAASRCASRRTNVPRGVFASHPSRSRKAAKRKVPKVTKMDVVTKLQMWGVDVDRMRGETRLPDPRASSRSSTEEPGSATTDPSTGSPPFEPREPDASDSGDRASAPASTSSSSSRGRVLELIARQEAENWPAVGTDEWLLARLPIISASEASAALGVDRFRSPERLIRDKLARLDALDRTTPAETLARAAAEAEAESLARSADLGWRAASGTKAGARKRRKGKRAKRGSGAGGRSSPPAENGAKATPPAVAHGVAFEPLARAHYCRVENEIVHEFGLKIHDDLPWLGATPDGVSASGAVLEIKCPYSRPVLPKVRAAEHNPQLQVLMRVFDLAECHFVQYKPPGVGTGRAGVMNEDRPLYLRETVARDDGWWAANEPRLRAFHRKLEDAMRERRERLARFADGGGTDGANAASSPDE